jgi:hypothetical protein
VIRSSVDAWRAGATRAPCASAAITNKPVSRWTVRQRSQEAREVLLLPDEGVTLLSLRSLLSVHMLVGVALIPPVALKLGSAFYPFFRYYRGSPAFREKRPPQLAMGILVAPALVVSTIGLFGTGVVLLLLEHADQLVYTVHKAGFIVWIGAIGIHVLAYLRHLPALALADWMRGPRDVFGRALRRRAGVAPDRRWNRTDSAADRGCVAPVTRIEAFPRPFT